MSSLAPSPRRVWRAARLPVLIGLLVVLTATVLAAFADSGRHGLLDPTATDPHGSRALAQLLRDQGVDVQLTRSADDVRGAGPDTTVLVPFPTYLSTASAAAVRQTRADVVLVGPGERIAALTDAIAVTTSDDQATPREPGCELPAAVAAGRVDLGGELYRPLVDGATACYPGTAGSMVVQVTEGHTVTAVGDFRELTNGALTDEGNAALAVGLLGARSRLLWYLPSQADLGEGGPKTFFELIPPWVSWVLWQLTVAGVLAALWRGRRLGRVVREPLPVVVPASEAVLGRARLYRRSRARGHAADTLRGASRARLLPLLGLPAAARPPELVGAVADRTGRGGPELEALLYGPAPQDDLALVELARALDACEDQVRRS